MEVFISKWVEEMDKKKKIKNTLPLTTWSDESEWTGAFYTIFFFLNFIYVLMYVSNIVYLQYKIYSIQWTNPTQQMYNIKIIIPFIHQPLCFANILIFYFAFALYVWKKKTFFLYKYFFFSSKGGASIQTWTIMYI